MGHELGSSQWWKEEREAFDAALPHIEFPTDNIKFGTLRKMAPEVEALAGIGNAASGPFSSVLEYERQLAGNMLIQARHGNIEYPEPDCGLMSDVIQGDKEALQQCYQRAGLAAGGSLFNEQIKTIENSISKYVKSLSK